MDKPFAERLSLDSRDLASCREDMRWLLRVLIAQKFEVLLLVYDESDDCVRPFFWAAEALDNRAPGWHQNVPYSGRCGLQILRELRMGAGLHGQTGRALVGALRCRYDGQLRRLRLESPQEWYVRLLTGEKTPTSLPYKMVYTGV